MKSESSDYLLKPDLMFRVVSGHPPADIETVAEFEEWKRADDERVLVECMRLFRLELDRAFQQLEGVEQDSTHADKVAA